MLNPPKVLVDAICDSLNSDGKWRFDRFNVTHESGINIWIANEMYGLCIEADGVKYGGVVCVGWKNRWRRRIRKAVDAYIARRVQASMERMSQSLEFDQ